VLFGSLIVLSVPSTRPIKTKILTLSLVVFISTILIIGTGFTVYAQQQTRVFIVGSDGTTHEANLKATKDGDGQLRKVSGFEIEASNVVQINQGKDLIVFTTNPAQDQVQKVKIRNTQGQLTELQKSTGVPNTYSLAGYPVGVYVLDVIVQLSNSNRQGAYETILVIIPPNQQPQLINFPLILQTIKTVIDTDIRIIDNGDDDDDDNKPPPCPLGQRWDPVQKKCLPIPPPPPPPPCDPEVDPECPEPPPPPCDPEVDPECPEPPPPPCDPEVDPECPEPPPPPPPGPCPEGEDCPTPPPPPPPTPCEGENCPIPPGPGLLPGPEPEPEPIEEEEEEESETLEDDGEGGDEGGDDGGDGGDGGDGSNGGNGGGGESGSGETE
jgi:uncharacterized membrane protein YgcG